MLRKWEDSCCHNTPPKRTTILIIAIKKGDKNKKVDNAKSEDKSDDNAGTVGAHVGEVTPNRDKISTPNDSSSIGAHVSDVTKTLSNQHNMYKISW